MLIGELEYDDLLENKNLRVIGTVDLNGTGHINATLEEELDRTTFPFTAHVIVSFFMFFMAIIVINLQHMATLTEMKKNIALRK